VRARGSRRPRRHRDRAGYTLVELLVVVGIVGAVLIAAVPALDAAIDAADGVGAARYLAAVVARARLDAARGQRAVAVRFTRGTSVSFTVVVDGDGDGVRSDDVVAGIDRPTRVADRLEDHFPRVRFGISRSVPGIDDARPLTAADDPVRFGAADQLTLTPIGTATSGTAYITSRGGVQFAVRISGVTGRARVLRYDHGRAAWRPL
jgi:prepilin-type N-terminal cleavage/methylation domain-containing protein